MTEPIKNDFSGSAHIVVQAGTIEGGVHFGAQRAYSAPQQLPPASRAFVGRDGQLATLDDVLLPGPGATSTALIVGAPGTGKTALALQWAHQNAGGFEDGVLYCDLQGWGISPPVEPDVAVADFLLALGGRADDLPNTLAGRTAAYRSRIAGRRLLVVLDNVRSAAQITPLLPTSPLCSVIVTSRHDLPSLVIHRAATRVTLRELEIDDAVGLLRRFVGDRPASDRDRLEDLAAICGHLPLALMVVAEALVSRPSLAVDSVLTELADVSGRLKGLRGSDETSDVRTVFSWSYGLLDELGKKAFVAVGLIPGRTFTPSLVGAVSGMPTRDAATALRALARAHLVTELSEDRYFAHDLLRLYAADLASDGLGPDGLLAGRKRLFDYYLRISRRADQLIAPRRYRTEMDPDVQDIDIAALGFISPVEALEWLDVERDNVVAACRIDDPALDRRRWQLAHYYRGYFFLSKLLDAWLEAHQLALGAAVRSGDKHGEALCRSDLGLALDERGEGEAALEQFELASNLFEEIGDEYGQHSMMGRKARVRRLSGDADGARDLLETALTFYRANDLQRNVAITLRSLALAKWALEDADAAKAHLQEAAQICAVENLDLEGAMTQNSLGAVLARAGHPLEAEQAYDAARAAAIGCGAGYEVARALRGLATLRSTDDPETAARHLEEARTLLLELGSRDVTEVEEQLRLIIRRLRSPG
ncbi:NB-ARC domain-containing protein [Kribbella lupini]|uniref:XRE family transcriptional regulator n=1 Tax=Kribbella lupini TaxID=291602 RepID=A0ABP4NH77_9ACTN